MAVPVVLAPLVGLLVRMLVAAAATKAVLWVIKVMGVLGIAFATNEYVVEPVIDMVTTSWNGLPADIAMWGRALGITEAASLLLSAYTIMAGKKVFLTAIDR